ncbi:MAG TPA: hemolysin family protein [Chthoniobacteraceae bacterium]|nr:hemolysin family protein [Chthoniobacteraceae bacterium]
MVGATVLALVLLVLLAGSALFSAIEVSFFSMQPLHIERLRKRRAEFADTLIRLMENPRRLLSAILLADALINLPLIVLCLFLVESRAATWPFWVVALGIFGIVVFLCDLVPKVVALVEPYRIAKLGVSVMRVVMPIVDPVAIHLQRFAEAMAGLLTPARFAGANFLSEEELGTLVELSAEEGTLHAAESEMIQEIIKLGDKSARDCMTPRVDSFMQPDDLTNEELIPKLRAGRHRFVPIYGATPDDILGVLDVRRFLLAPALPYVELLTPASFVPETMKAIDLLRSFLRHPQRIAIVVDEHGGTEGVITLSDIVEEIISDAVPQAEEELYIEALGNGRLIVNGNARLDDINEMLGSQLAEEGIDTIGGLIFNRNGSLPKTGATLEIDRLVLTVRRVSRKRVEEVLIAPKEPAETPED